MPLDCFELGEFFRGALLKEGRLLVDRHPQEDGVGPLMRVLWHNAIGSRPTGKRADGTLSAQVTKAF